MAIAVLVLLFGLGVWLVSYTTVAGVRVSGRDVSWLAGTQQVRPDIAALYMRYLERHRRHRLAGGLFGALFAVTVGIRWYGSVSIGIGEGNPLADVLFCTLAGVLAGALSAETYRLSEPQSPTIAASLAERSGMPVPKIARIAQAVTAVSLVIGAGVAASGHGSTALLVAIAGVAALLVAELTQAAIAGRRRPVLSEQAQAADLRMRAFASRSVTMLQLALAVLTAGWTVAKVPGIDQAPLAIIRWVVVLGCIVATVVLIRRAAPRPPRKWTPHTA